MNATIENEARLNVLPGGKGQLLPAMLTIDGVKWFSSLPETSGEAFAINQQARAILAAINEGKRP